MEENGAARAISVKPHEKQSVSTIAESLKMNTESLRMGHINKRHLLWKCTHIDLLPSVVSLDAVRIRGNIEE